MEESLTVWRKWGKKYPEIYICIRGGEGILEGDSHILAKPSENGHQINLRVS